MEEKRRMVDIVDEAIIRFIKNRNEALEKVDIEELFPDKANYMKAREQFAERMGVDIKVIKKIFKLLYSEDSESSSK